MLIEWNITCFDEKVFTQQFTQFSHHLPSFSSAVEQHSVQYVSVFQLRTNHKSVLKPEASLELKQHVHLCDPLVWVFSFGTFFINMKLDNAEAASPVMRACSHKQTQSPCKYRRKVPVAVCCTQTDILNSVNKINNRFVKKSLYSMATFFLVSIHTHPL